MALSELRDRLQQGVGDAYRIERELGGGGMSYVFLATEAGLNRKVVIKVLAPELTNDVMTARFRREMEVTALLQHPHILPVLTTGTRDGLLYYVTPFIEGESLRHRLERDGRLSIEDAVRILAEVSSALAYAHDRNVVHRDIKPENILLSNGLVVLADFGISGVLTGTAESTGSRLTELGMSLGTPGYMSPEQAAGERELDARSDQYSLAVVGYEMLTGKPPFSGTTPLSIMTAHLTEVPGPVESKRIDAPPNVARAIARALSKKPEDRFTSQAEFRQALGVSWSGRNAAVPRLRARWGLLAGAGVVAAAAIGTLWLGSAAESGGPNESVIAIAPFDLVGANDAMLREGLVDLLAANLDGAGPLRTVSPSVVIQRWKDSRADRPSALALGQATRAGIAVFGSVVSAGRDSVRVRATVLDTQRDAVIGRPIDYADETLRLDRITDSLTFAILSRLNEARGLGATRSASLGTSSIAAMKAYLVGEQHYRHGNWDSAATHYRQAIAADSAFAPAYRRLGNALGWTLTPELGLQREAYETSLLAGTLNRGLAPRESLLVGADSVIAALFVGRLGPGERYRLTKRVTDLLEEGARRFPDDPEIWFKLGDVRAHFASAILPSRANVATTREAFARSLALDSAFGPSYIHYFGGAALEQDVDGLRASMRAFLALDPQDEQGDAVRYLYPLFDGRGRPPSDSALNALSPAALVNAIAMVAGLMDSAETQIRLIRHRVNDARGRGAPAEARVQLAAFLALRGHYDESLSMAAESIGTAASTFWLFAEAALAGAIPADSARRLFGRWLDAGNLRQALSGSTFWADVGDTASLQRVISAADALERQGPTGVPFQLLRGMLSIARRDTAAAIRELAVSDSACLGWCSQARLPLARLLSASGRDSAAAVILQEDYPQPTGTKVLWALERGRVNERLGRTPEAVDAYTFVARAWRGGDASVQPVVREAEAGLARLAPDRTNR